MATSNRKWVIAGAFLTATLLAWASGLVATRVAASFLSLPEDAELEDLADAVIVGSDELPPNAEDELSDPSSTASTSAARRPSRKSKGSWVDPIIKRSIFDSTKVGTEATVDTENLEDGRKSDLKVVLLATVVAEPEVYSSALIAEEKGRDGAVGYGIGDTLLDEAEIVKIEQRKVFVKRSDGTIEYIAMDGSSYTKEKDSEGSKGLADASGEGVEKSGDNKYVVDRELIDKALENPEKLASQIRVVPHKDANGDIDGYRLSGIRRKSLFYKLGVKNGDVVHNVNGRDLTSVSAAMDAYNSLQNESNFSFDLTRRNKRQTFEYEVR